MTAVHDPVGTLTAPTSFTGKPAEEARLPRWHTATAGVLLALHAVLAWLTRQSAPATSHDDATYVLLARALRHLRYSDIWLLDAPPHSMYPPVYPAMLALLGLPFGENDSVFIAASILCSLAALWLVYDMMKRRAGGIAALLVLAVCVVNPELLYYAGSDLSEAPYMLLTALALWATLREPTNADAGTARRWATLAIVAAILASLTRSIGVTLLGGMFVGWLIERRYRRVVALSIAGALTTGGWLVWTVVAPGQIVGRSYVADAMYTADPAKPAVRVQNPVNAPAAPTPAAGPAGVTPPRRRAASSEPPPSLAMSLVKRLQKNIPDYLQRHLPWIMPEPVIAGTAVDNVLGVVLLTALLAIGAVVLWGQARMVGLYLAMNAGLLLVWPWNSERFLVPFLPFLLWAVVAGGQWLASRVRWLAPIPYAFIAVLIATALALAGRRIVAAAGCDRNDVTKPGCYPVEKAGFIAASRWLVHGTPDSAVILASKDASAGFHSDRRILYSQALSIPSADSLKALLRNRRVEYLLITPLASMREQFVAEFIQSCSELEVVKQFQGRNLIVRLPAAGRPPPPENACAALDAYAKADTPDGPLFTR